MGNKKILMILALVFSGISASISLLPYVFIWLVVKGIIGNDGQVFDEVNHYAWWAVASAVLGILTYFITLAFSHLAAFRFECNFRQMGMEKLIKMPLGFFTSKMGGQMRKIIDDEASRTHTFLAHILPDVVGSILTPIVVVALLFVFDWRLGVACLVPLAIGFIIMSYMTSPKRNEFQKEYLDAQELMSSEAVEYVRGIPVVKVFQQSVFSFKRFYDSIINYRRLVTLHTLRWRRPFSLYVAVTNGFAYFLIPVAILIIENGNPVGQVIIDLMFYLLIAPQISTSIMKIAYLQNNLFLASEAVNRLENLLIEDTILPTPTHSKHIENYDISFDSVEFKYANNDNKVLDGISFSIPEGKNFALVGPSGGGKTTIARLIPRFWDVISGSVNIGGTNVKDISKEELMNKVSFVFQNTKLFKTTLRENITYGTPNASEEDINRAIDLSQSREIIDKLPRGLDTKIGVDGTYLSGGEQQRIALARAFLKDAPILVLDEATAFADPENEYIIQRALRELMKGKTVLMIAHRLTSVQNADKILVIENGKIAESGKHEELLSLNGTYKTMWDEYQSAISWTIN